MFYSVTLVRKYINSKLKALVGWRREVNEGAG